MSNHARLSASGAKRWMMCPPSVTFEEQFPETKSVYADEGTLAHSISELLIPHLAFGTPFDKRMKELRENELYNDEMMEYCMEYAQFVVDKVRNTKGYVELVQEEKLDLREFIREGYGTIDVGIISDYVLETVDLKYGKGVPVDAYEIEQQMVYALGMLMKYKLLFDVKIIRMTIYQPRIGNISEYEITTENLLKWGYETLKPAAKLAWKGEGEYVAGDHCRFCRAKSLCKTFAKYNLELAGKDFAEPNTLTDQQIVKILARAPSMKRWITSIEDYALSQAMAGRKWPEMKVVLGRSIRKIKDPAAIIEGLQKEGIDEAKYINKKLLGITLISKNLPKLQFQQIVEPQVFKPSGDPALVLDIDPRT